MNAADLASIAGVFLSLGFSYLPGLEDWYNGLDNKRKVGVMGAALVLVAVGAFGLGCLGWADLLRISVSCDAPGAVSLVRVLVAALVANQATYLIAVKPLK